MSAASFDVASTDQRFAPNTVAAAMGEWIVVEPFEVIAWDFIGPMTLCYDFRYLLIAADYATRRVEAEPIPSADKLCVLAMLVFIVNRFGSPRIRIADRANTFKAQGF